jgi:hypothetical protein
VQSEDQPSVHPENQPSVQSDHRSDHHPSFRLSVCNACKMPRCIRCCEGPLRHHDAVECRRIKNLRKRKWTREEVVDILRCLAPLRLFQAQVYNL